MFAMFARFARFAMFARFARFARFALFARFAMFARFARFARFDMFVRFDRFARLYIFGKCIRTLQNEIIMFWIFFLELKEPFGYREHIKHLFVAPFFFFGFACASGE